MRHIVAAPPARASRRPAIAPPAPHRGRENPLRIGAAIRRGPSLTKGGGNPEKARLANAPTQVKILVPADQMVALIGQHDELLKLVEAAFDADILVRGNEITIGGRDATSVDMLFRELLQLIERGHELTPAKVGHTIDIVRGNEARPTEVLGDVLLSGKGRSIAPKTVGQKRYVDAIRRATITFSVGPAGTGKTYLAVATAVKALEARDVSRLILTR